MSWLLLLIECSRPLERGHSSRPCWSGAPSRPGEGRGGGTKPFIRGGLPSVTASRTERHGPGPQQGIVPAGSRKDGTSRCDARRDLTGAGGRCGGQREGDGGTRRRYAETGPDVAVSARFCAQWDDVRVKRAAKRVHIAACPRASPGREQNFRTTCHTYAAPTGMRCPLSHNAMPGRGTGRYGRQRGTDSRR